MEPALEAEDIQGHVLVGFGPTYQQILGVRIAAGREVSVKATLRPWVDLVTPVSMASQLKDARRTAMAQGQDVPLPRDVLLAIGVTKPGLDRLGVATNDILDPSFLAGAASDASSIGDPVDAADTPIGWRFGATPDATPDILCIFAGGDEQQVAAVADDLLHRLGDAVSVLYKESAARLPGDTEHFGFRDGISQPGVRGRIAGDALLTPRLYPPADPLADRFARPGQPLTWPGQFVFGYPGLDPGDVTQPGPVTGQGSNLLKNGSLLVFRRMTQDVAAFNAAMSHLAEALTAQTGHAFDAVQTGALCVGRWKDGTPVVVAPDAPKPEVSGDFIRLNGFQYEHPLTAAALTSGGASIAFPGAPGDANGAVCPFSAHIRKVNPRDQNTDLDGPPSTLGLQMLRRGVPFGPAFVAGEETEERGLLFMSYQTSIDAQFHQIMTRWVARANRPKGPSGVDPVIGPVPPLGRTFSIGGATPAAVNLMGGWVKTTGAAYCLVPGKATLRSIFA